MSSINSSRMGCKVRPQLPIVKENLFPRKFRVLLIILNLCSPYIHLSLLLPNRRKGNVPQYKILGIKVRIYADHYIKAAIGGECGYSIFCYTV